jgi:hypothetical protein
VQDISNRGNFFLFHSARYLSFQVLSIRYLK